MNWTRVGAQQRLILIGMMGSGKTTIGRLLARETGWPYVDNDTVLSEQSAETAREIAAEGEAAVRTAESAALRQELASPEPSIVGAAAGTVLDPTNRELIVGAGLVVWLRARPETLAGRATKGDHRPWLESDPIGWFRIATAERDPLYASIADVTAQVDDATPPETVAWILGQPTVSRLMNRRRFSS